MRNPPIPGFDRRFKKRIKKALRTNPIHGMPNDRNGLKKYYRVKLQEHKDNNQLGSYHACRWVINHI